LPSTWPVPQSIGVRLLAYLIDLVIIAVGSSVAAGVIVAAAGGPSAVSPDARLLVDLVLWSLGFLYFFLFEGGVGKTAGKAILGLRVVRVADPWRTTWGGAFLRTLLRPVDFILLGLPGVALIGATASRQRLGDMAGRTLVVKLKPWHEVPWQFAPAFPGLMPCPLCGRPMWVGMTVCNHCGAYWVPAAPQQAAAAPIASAATQSGPLARVPARDELLALLHDDDAWVRCLAVRELVAQDPADIDTAGPALDSCDPLLRLRLVDLVARDPDPASDPLLVRLCGDRNSEVADQAQGALRYVRSLQSPPSAAWSAAPPQAGA
jgi:uncharacterized RDD family membrane protein YckC